jgi:hypothetical protein
MDLILMKVVAGARGFGLHGALAVERGFTIISVGTKG